MTSISPAQRKIIIIASGIGSLFLLASFFICWTENNKLGQLKAELNVIENQIQEIEGAEGNGQAGTEITSMEEQYRQVESKFPPKEEEDLRLLSDFARGLDIKIVSLRSQPKVLFQDQNNQKVEIDGKVCQTVLISIEMIGSYGDLVKYLETLKKSLPAYVSVERLRILKDVSTAPKLNITLELNLYLLA